MVVTVFTASITQPMGGQPRHLAQQSFSYHWQCLFGPRLLLALSIFQARNVNINSRASRAGYRKLVEILHLSRTMQHKCFFLDMQEWYSNWTQRCAIHEVIWLCTAKLAALTLGCVVCAANLGRPLVCVHHVHTRSRISSE